MARIRVAATALLLFAGCGQAQQLQCPQHVNGLAYKMLQSNIARGQGIEAGNASTAQIELGIFQKALRESIALTNNTSEKHDWGMYLQNSTLSAIDLLSNATADAGFPLDRLSIGSSMIQQYQTTKDEAYLPAIKALQKSVEKQQRNANGGLWYYANPNNLSAYHNLSYSDGMFSYPPFAILSYNGTNGEDNGFGSLAAIEQVQIIYDICKDNSGLVRHGYDASKDHKWADPETGASPVVWGRSLAWYTLGIVESLGLLQSSGSRDQAFHSLKHLFVDLIRAQLTASDHSLQIGGSYGVWQVVDQPGASFDGHENFIEASASCLTAYSLLKGVRAGLIAETDLKHRAKLAGVGIFKNVLESFLIENGNGTLSLNGTSSVASLSGDVDFSYYVSRPTVLNSLIGTSAFILAAIEVERIC